MEGKYKEKGFSLAETMIIVAILGIIAAILIPSAITRSGESTNRVKLKKALEVYGEAVRTMVSESGIKPSRDKFKNWANCEIVKQYFKSVQNGEVGENKCQFKTSDGVWWDFGSNPNGASAVNALVAFKRGDLTQDNGWDESTNKAFYFRTDFDSKGGARIQDAGYFNMIGDIDGVIDSAKTYAFINKKKLIDYFTICNDEPKKTSCVYLEENGDAYREAFFNQKGRRTMVRYGCNSEGTDCTSSGIPKEAFPGFSVNGNCNKRGICVEGEYSLSKKIETPKNFREDISYNNIEYELESVRNTGKNCQSDTTDLNTDFCKTLGYDAIYTYKNSKGVKEHGIEVLYTDSTRTTISKVIIFDYAGDGGWINSKTFNCPQDISNPSGCI